MFDKFPKITVEKTDNTRFDIPSFHYHFSVEYNGETHRLKFQRNPHIYKNEEAWLWDARRTFKKYVKNKTKERPVGVFYI